MFVKCVACGNYIDTSEEELVPVDDTHDAVYCVKCSPVDLSDVDDNDPDYSGYDED